MAKVMVSMPDELLARVDAEAARQGTTRSALLRRFAGELIDDNIRHRALHRRQRLARLGRMTGEFGGGAAEQLKRNRPS